MSKIKALAVGAALLFAGTALAASAGAVTVPMGNTQAPVATSSDIQPVAMKKWYYKNNRHGDRFRHRSRDHHFFRDGFWYTAPFWLYTAPLYAEPGYDYGYEGDHVGACYARYRTYDRYSDTFIGFDGLRHRCMIY